jgi:glycine/D-amino acid oxidase-like deaminating enzyme
MTDAHNIRDVVIIGRGFAGLSLAVELAQSGAARVEIIYDENDACEASSAAHGISTIKGIFEADSDLFSKKIEGHRGFNDWLQSLEILVGAKRPPDVWRSGVSESFNTAEDFRKDFGRIYRKDFVGLKNVKMDFTVKDQFATALYPADFWIDPKYLLDLLIAASKRLGVVITAGRVLKIHRAHGYSELVLKSANAIKTRCAVVCAGAGTAALIPRDGPEALHHLFAVAGCTFRARSDQMELCEVKGTAGVMSFGKNIYWGSTSERTQEILATVTMTKPPSISEQIFSGQKLLSKLGRHTISPTSINPAWGVRVRTRKRDPFVGCADPLANVWASTGFYKSGITLCWLLSKSVSKKLLESITISEHQATSNR